MSKSRVNRRTVKRQNRKQNRRQRGGKIVLPMEYFGNKNKHYSENPTIAEGQFASSHGVPIPGQQAVGPDLRIAASLKQNGGGVLPAEYYGGNSGRYYEEGAPELANCESAYGTIFPSSHGVVMPGENSQWMGPNLAVFPNATKLQTGGRKRTRTRRTKRGGSRRTKSRRTKRGGGCGSCPGNKHNKKAKKGKGKKASRSRSKSNRNKKGCGCRKSCKKC